MGAVGGYRGNGNYPIKNTREKAPSLFWIANQLVVTTPY